MLEDASFTSKKKQLKISDIHSIISQKFAELRNVHLLYFQFGNQNDN